MSRAKASKTSGRLKDYREAETWLVPRSRGAGLRVGLVYPSTYYVGMSSLGYQLIYRLLAERPDVLVERLFYQGPQHRPTSVESKRPAADFDVLLFSCAFEPDYLNLIRFLLDSEIEPRAAQRTDTAPLLLAGGIAVTANPAPLARILDGFLLGDGEGILGEAFDRLGEMNLRSSSRESVLQQLSEIESAYFPLLHGYEDEHPFTKRVVKNLDAFPTGSAVLTPHTDLSEMFLVEVARGCARGCSFCLTGNFNHQLRLRSVEGILEQVDGVRERIRKVGLIASEFACHPGATELCESLVARGLEISTSSLEIDRVSREQLDLLVRGGQKTLTLAPETGDEELRFALNKKISNEKMFAMAAMAAEAGIERLKLYLILGMPHSPENEIEPLIRFLQRTREVFFAPGGRRRKELIVSAAPFVPKPHTPWAREPMLPEREIKQRLRHLRREAGKRGGIRVTGQSATLAALEAMIALGDSTVGPVLLEALRESATPRSIARRLRERGTFDPYTARPHSTPAQGARGNPDRL